MEEWQFPDTLVPLTAFISDSDLRHFLRVWFRVRRGTATAWERDFYLEILEIFG